MRRIRVAADLSAIRTSDPSIGGHCFSKRSTMPKQYHVLFHSILYMMSMKQGPISRASNAGCSISFFFSAEKAQSW